MRTLIFGLQSFIAATLVLCSIAQKAHAQQPDASPVKYAVQAAQFCQEGQFEKAEAAIAQALRSDAEKDMFYTWYVKGFIHKEIYKARESANPQSPQRDMAVQAFLKSKEMADGYPDTYNKNSALKYLATTYYNDAISIAGKFDLAKEMEADAIMVKYEALCKATDNGMLNKGAFYKQKGMRYYELWQQNTCDLSLNEKSFACFQTAFELDASDCDAWYNAGIVRYSLIQKMRTDKPSGCNLQIDENAELNFVADILLRGRKSCASHTGILKALQNTYMALGDYEKAGQYENQLKP